jgi:hypothetical protein
MNWDKPDHRQTETKLALANTAGILRQAVGSNLFGVGIPEFLEFLQLIYHAIRCRMIGCSRCRATKGKKRAYRMDSVIGCSSDTLLPGSDSYRDPTPIDGI